LLAREAILETEVVPAEVRLVVVHPLIPEVAEAEMHRAASRLRVLTMLPYHPVQILQDVVIEEAEVDTERTGIATFLHLSTPNWSTYRREI
jgi:hypothetical protein